MKAKETAETAEAPLCGEPFGDGPQLIPPTVADLSGDAVASEGGEPDQLPLHAQFFAVSTPNLSQAEATTILRALGWRIRTTGEYHQVVKLFQNAWNLGAALSVDGLVGPHTSSALRISEGRRRGRQTTASAHFSFTEFQCQCGGSFKDCARIVVYRELLSSLESFRIDAYPSGLSIVSGYRCPSHNKAVGGAQYSQHLYGTAADVPLRFSWQKTAKLRLFAGIGKEASNGLVRHVDRRDVGGHNLTHGTLPNPTIWNY